MNTEPLRLEWRTDPNHPKTIFGFSPAMPSITLAIIELSPTRDDRGNLTGAFIPDEEEGQSHLVNSPVSFLKGWALGTFWNFMSAHEAQDTAEAVTEITKEAEVEP